MKNLPNSAFELAYSWTQADQFPDSVSAVFKSFNNRLFVDMKDIELAIPEHKVILDNGRAPSQNDLFVLAQSEHGLVTIMVEGKERQFENVKQPTTREITFSELERLNQYVRNKGWTPLDNSVTNVPNGTEKIGLWISNEKAKNRTG